MQKIIGRSVSLRQIEESDFPTLYVWRNSNSYRKYCSTRRDKISYDEYREEMRRDLAKDRHLQCVILHGSKVIGTIFSYGMNRTDGYTFITTYIEDAYDKKGYGAEAFALFSLHLFRSSDLYKIYTEAYSYNAHSIKCIQRAGLREEGRFVGHRTYDGRRYDLIRFALFIDQLPSLEKFVGRLTRVRV